MRCLIKEKQRCCCRQVLQIDHLALRFGSFEIEGIPKFIDLNVATEFSLIRRIERIDFTKAFSGKVMHHLAALGTMPVASIERIHLVPRDGAGLRDVIFSDLK